MSNKKSQVRYCTSEEPCSHIRYHKYAIVALIGMCSTMWTIQSKMGNSLSSIETSLAIISKNFGSVFELKPIDTINKEAIKLSKVDEYEE